MIPTCVRMHRAPQGLARAISRAGVTPFASLLGRLGHSRTPSCAISPACAIAPSWFREHSHRYSTFRHQRDLPRLPIPKLNDTCDKYLELVQPLVSSSEFESTTEIVGWFRGKEGQLLHRKLKELDEESPTSWLEGFWDTMYLEGRYPVPIHSNPYFVFTDVEDSDKSGAQVNRATSVVHSTLKFVHQLREKKLKPDKEGGQHLCMTQYRKFLGTARIPLVGRDELVTNHHSKHIIVMRQNHMYRLQVMDKQHNIISKDDLTEKLAAICAEADQLPTEESDGTAVGGVGLLTSQDRDVWARAREQLVEDPVNAESIQSVDGALLILCLDTEDVTTLEESSHAMLHNYGNNRWFDKMQIVVEKSGRAGLNMEHAPNDGHTVLRLATDVHNDHLGIAPLTLGEGAQELSDLPPPTRLEWKIDNELIESITDASRAFDALTEKTQSCVLPFRHYGKEHIKSLRLSPDAFVQMAYQLAYFRLHRRISSTYESANTKGFRHGRTETIRTASLQSEAFCRGFNMDDKAGTRRLLDEAVKQHVRHSKDCKNGMGVDRHLFGLRNLAIHQRERIANYRIPSIFSDPSYATFTSNILSTSNCGGDAMQLFGFGPVHAKGLGIGYMIKNNEINISVTSFRQQAEDYVEAVEKALLDMSDVCQ